MSLTTEHRALKSVLICAPNPREGATTVALGLALAAARQGDPVLLIDGNLYTPAVCGAFGLPELTGLADLIAGRVNLGVAVQQTRIANLWVVGPGSAPLGFLKGLEPPRLAHLLAELARPYALVIIDGPALNAYPESVLYAAQVDRTFLVLHSGVSRVPVVKAALEKLAAAGGINVDIILNRRTFYIPEWIYKRL